MRKFLIAALATITALAVLAPVSASADAPVATYEVTITNLTEGQPFTPPLVAVHRKPVDVFTVGQSASTELQEIAENGNLGPALAALDPATNNHVSSLAPLGGPLVPGGLPSSGMFDDEVTLTVTGDTGAKYLTWASMLICTNDGFTGIDGIRLPKEVGDSVTVTTDAYDAGTEVNTEDFADIVPPCQGLVGNSSDDPGTGTSNPLLAEGGVIHHHGGIAGGDDLTSLHAWTDPVAVVSIVRVD